MVRRALTSLVELTDNATYSSLLENDGIAAAYAAGVYLWLTEVTEAMTVLANQLNALTPDWAEYRHRIEEVAWLYDMALAEQMKLDGALDRSDENVALTFEEIFVALVTFKVRLAEPFG